MNASRLLIGLLAPLALCGCAGAPRQHELLLEGERAYQGGDYRTAVERLAPVVREGDADVAARAAYVRGMALALLGRRNEAYGDLQRALQAGTTELGWRPAGALGTLYFEDERWDQAARFFSAALVRGGAGLPADVYLFRFAQSQERLGNWSAALETFARLAKEHPGSAYAASARRRLALRADSFAIQCGVFAHPANAERLAQQLQQGGLRPVVRAESRADGTVHVVLEGRYPTYAQAVQALGRVRGYVPEAVLWP